MVSGVSVFEYKWKPEDDLGCPSLLSTFFLFEIGVSDWPGIFQIG